MFTLAKAFVAKYSMWLVGAAVATVIGAFGWMAIDLTLTKAALENAEVKLEASEQIIAAQARAMEAVNRIDELEGELDDLRRQGRARMAQAQGSANEIPPEVSAAFIANSDSVLAHRGNPRAAEELRLPSRTPEVGYVLGPTLDYTNDLEAALVVCETKNTELIGLIEPKWPD